MLRCARQKRSIINLVRCLMCVCLFLQVQPAVCSGAEAPCKSDCEQRWNFDCLVSCTTVSREHTRAHALSGMLTAGSHSHGKVRGGGILSWKVIEKSWKLAKKNEVMEIEIILKKS